MSLITEYSRDEFEREFPLDFGDGMRAQVLNQSTILLTHLVDYDKKKFSCAVVLSFNDDNPLWGLNRKQLDCLTINSPIKCINCPEHREGRIVGGKWEIL